MLIPDLKPKVTKAMADERGKKQDERGK